jgi:adenosylhomocysteine nucleosidase
MNSKTLLCLFTGITCLAIFALQSAPSYAHVGIITALDNTFEQIKKKIEITDHSVISGRTFYQGRMDGRSITLVRSPMGKVNNAITAQLLISSFEVKGIISLSPAGALLDSVNIGDVLVARKVYQHDFGTWKPYGFIWGQVPVENSDITLEYNNFPVHDFTGRVPKITGKSKIIWGAIVSGDQFIAASDKRNWLNTKFKADAVDMGAAAIVQVCYSSNTPVIIIRVITDFAGENARVAFADSMPAYQTDISLPEFILHLSTLLISQNKPQQTNPFK